MPLILIDRFRPRLRSTQQHIIDSGHLRLLDEQELLTQEQLAPLARLSLQLLLIGGLCFVLLNLAAYYLHTGSLAVNTSFLSIVGWLLLNIIGYVLILPIHELIHAATILLWGGKPYFGAKLPLALYCGAKNQVFPRNYYLTIALAPLVIITAAGALLTLLAPVAASYTLFATIGNISGAAGDVWSVLRMRSYPSTVLLEDTSSGFRVWQLTPAPSNDTLLS